MRLSKNLLPLLVLSLAVGVGTYVTCSCGRGKSGGAALAPVAGLPVTGVMQSVDEHNLGQALRRLREMDFTSQAYLELRGKVLAVLMEKHEGARREGEIKEAHFWYASAVELLGPEEILSGNVPPQIENMSRWVVETFSPLGDEAKVMTALLVLMGRHKHDKCLKGELDTLMQWVWQVREGLDEVERMGELISLYEEVAWTTPVPLVTSRLLDLYRSRQQLFTEILDRYRSKGESPGEMDWKYYFLQAGAGGTSYDIVRLFTRLGRPADALAPIEKLRGKLGYDPKLVRVLEKIGSDPTDAQAYLDLSEIFAEAHPKEAIWSCYEGWKKAPLDWKMPLCISRLYRKMGDMEGAEEYLVIARSVDDKVEEIYLALMDLYRNWLDSLGEDESTGEPAQWNAEDEDEEMKRGPLLAGKLEEVYLAYKQRWPGGKPPIEWSGILRRKGLIAYSRGEIAEAIKYFEEAGLQFGDIDSLQLLGTIYMYKSNTERALATLKEALKVPYESKIEQGYYHLFVYKRMGDAARTGGMQKEAEQHYLQSLELVEMLRPYVSLDHVPELRAAEGELLHRLGKRRKALESFKMAVSLSKDHWIYAGILSFLVGAGDMTSLREIFHLAYTDSRIPPKWKIYFSLWYLAFQKLSGEEIDPTPRHVLDTVKEKGWPGKLADYYTGRLSFEEVSKEVSTPGQKVELSFFRAFELAREVGIAQFVNMMNDILESNLFAYYEVVMAFEILKQGSAGIWGTWGREFR